MKKFIKNTVIKALDLFGRSDSDKVKGVNTYWRKLSKAEIALGLHRQAIGGMWDEVGQLQFEFLLKRGLTKESKLLDVGCGAMRGGVHFVDYLESGNYFGVDINESIVEAGKKELFKKDLLNKNPHLLVDDKFDFSSFREKFDYALAVSVFTHLPCNHIIMALFNVEKAIRSDGKFYATFFEAPRSCHFSDILHSPGNVTTHYDSDPFHYSVQEFEMMANLTGLRVSYVGDWGHPRNQKMLCFEK